MSLRTRLILAFFLLSVVPLTAVTLYSYRSSAAALRDAAEAEGRRAATEMSSRMELVTASLSQQLDRLWDLPREPLRALEGDKKSPEAAERLARALGTTAVFLDRLEFVPAPLAPAPPSPGATAGTRHPPAPPPPPGTAPDAPESPAAASRRARREALDAARSAAKDAAAVAAEARQQGELNEQVAAEQDRIVVDLNAILAEVTKEIEGAAKMEGKPPPPWAALLTQGIAQGLKMTAAVTAEGLRVGARELATHAQTAEGREALTSAHQWMQGALGVPIRRDGKVVGTVNAKVNLDRALGTVLGLARTDQGEVPFAFDEQGRLFTATPEHKAAMQGLGIAPSGGEPGATRVENRDKWVVVTHQDPSGLTFGIARPLGDSLESLRRATLRNLLLGLLVVGLAVIGIVPVSRGMTRDLSRLAESAREVAAGNFSVRVPVHSSDEIGRLAGAFNLMAKGVEAHQKLAIEQERLQRELELCRRIQVEMLPHGALKLGFAEVKGVSIPAREVGGDFFNYFVLDDGEVVLLVGDVSGKGVGAALLMANVQATLRARLPLERDLTQLVDAIDRDVDERTPGGVYVTLFIGILSPGTRRLRYVNAGHHPQFLLRHEGGLERMPSAGLPVGLYAGHGYKQREVMLGDGDLLFFYTDGMVETENEQGEMFGIERLEAVLSGQHDGDLDTVLERIETSVSDFRGKAELFDDATMMALRVADRRVPTPAS